MGLDRQPVDIGSRRAGSGMDGFDAALLRRRDERPAKARRLREGAFAWEPGGRAIRSQCGTPDRGRDEVTERLHPHPNPLRGQGEGAEQRRVDKTQEASFFFGGAIPICLRISGEMFSVPFSWICCTMAAPTAPIDCAEKLSRFSRAHLMDASRLRLSSWNRGIT